jgi:uncharacterized protein (TIGR03067 family)
MRGIGYMAAAVTLLAIGGRGSAGSEAAADRDRLQGSWAMVSLEINGEKADDDEIKAARLLVEGERYNPIYDERNVSETYILHPEMTPKGIDFTYSEGPRKGETVRGIYKLEGDRYTLCRAIQADDARPREFATRPDSNLAMVVWTRISAGDVARRRAVEVERKSLAGTWVGALGLHDGRPIVEDEPRQVRLIVSGDGYELERGEKTDRGTMVIDPTASPKTMDLVITEGEFKGETWTGIYEVAGYIHRACFAPAGKPRPTQFASPPGSGHVLWVFARPAPELIQSR